MTRHKEWICKNSHPQLFSTRDLFWRRQFCQGWGGGELGWFRCITFIMKFISIIISSALTSDHQALDPGGWGPLKEKIEYSVILWASRIAALLSGAWSFGFMWKKDQLRQPAASHGMLSLKLFPLKKEFIGPGLHLSPVHADHPQPPFQWTLNSVFSAYETSRRKRPPPERGTLKIVSRLLIA